MAWYFTEICRGHLHGTKHV